MSTVSLLAVSITIGTPDSDRMARQTSMPFMPGSIRSSSTTSGRSSRTAGRARVPSATTAVSKPSPRNTIVNISASAGSSSTTRTRDFMNAASHLPPGVRLGPVVRAIVIYPRSWAASARASIGPLPSSTVHGESQEAAASCAYATAVRSCSPASDS